MSIVFGPKMLTTTITVIISTVARLVFRTTKAPGRGRKTPENIDGSVYNAALAAALARGSIQLFRVLRALPAAAFADRLAFPFSPTRFAGEISATGWKVRPVRLDPAIRLG
jgi:hypothetical protein